MPLLAERHSYEASSDEDTSQKLYDYHTDNDNNSIEGSDDESGNTVPGLHERSCTDSRSDGDSVYCQDHDRDHTPATKHQSVQQSIDTRPTVHAWKDTIMDEDDYDADLDDGDMSTRARGSIAPLQLRRGYGILVVVTVIKEDTEKGIEE